MRTRLSYRVATAVALVISALALTPLGASAHPAKGASLRSPAWMRMAPTRPTAAPVGGALTEAELPGASNPSEPYAGVSRVATLHPAKVEVPNLRVNPVTGGLSFSLGDLSLPERGVPLGLSLTYNSYFASTGSPFGSGWSFNYGMSLTRAADGSVTISQENGSQVTFRHTRFRYVAPPRVIASLRVVSGRFVFTRGTPGKECDAIVTRSCLKSYFTKGATPATTGRLLKISSADGGLALDYAAGRLAAVTDPNGRKLTPSYKNNKCDEIAVSTTGFAAHMSYDKNGNLIRFTNAGGGRYGFLYDASHRLTGIVDPRGVKTDIAYDSAGHVLSITDPGGETDYTRSAAQTSISHPGVATTTVRYAAGEVTRVDQGDPAAPLATTLFTYDPATLGPTAVTDPDGHTSHMTYDARGRLTSYTDPLGKTSTRRFGVGVLTAEDPLGTRSRATTDSKGRLVSVALDIDHPALTQTTTFHYASASHPGDVTSVTDAEGHDWTFAYDKFGNPTRFTDPLGDTSTTSYDRMGRPAVNTLLNKAFADSPSTTYAYDPEGRLLSTTDPLGSTESFSYDAAGNLVATVAGGNQTSYGYDAFGHWTLISRPNGSRSTMSYLADGHVGEVCDDGGSCDEYTYDDLGRPATVTDPLGNTSSTAYSPGGMLLSSTDANGVTSAYSHDGDGRTTGVSYSDGVTHPVAVDFDADGRMVHMTDATGSSSFTYDSIGRLVLKANTLTPGVSYTFDRLNHVTKISLGSSVVADQTYDAAGRLIQLKDQYGNATGFSYDSSSNLTQTLFPGGDVDRDGYDAAGRLIHFSHSDSAGAPASIDIAYTRNLLGQITRADETGTGQPSLDYGYDPNGRARTVNGKPLTYSPRNDLLQNDSGDTFTYDAAYRLVSEHEKNAGGDLDWQFAFDHNGSRTSAFTLDGTRSHDSVWDAAGNLASFSGGSTSSETNTYDGFGQRVLVSGGGQTFLSVWGSTNKIGSRVWGGGASDPSYMWQDNGDLGFLADRSWSNASALDGNETDKDCGGLDFTCPADTTGPFNPLHWDKIAGSTPGSVNYKGTWNVDQNVPSLSKTDDSGADADPTGLIAMNGTVYLYDPDGLPVEQVDSSNHPLFYHHDQLGSTRAVTDASGDIVATYAYDTWGNEVSHTGTVSVPFGFAGGFTDPVSHLVLLGHDWYDPPTGQRIRRAITVGQNAPVLLRGGFNPPSLATDFELMFDNYEKGRAVPHVANQDAYSSFVAIPDRSRARCGYWDDTSPEWQTDGIGSNPYTLGGGDPVNRAKECVSSQLARNPRIRIIKP